VEAVKNLILLYVLILVINTIFTFLLWIRNRAEQQYKYMFFMWVAATVSFFVQGIFQSSTLEIALSSSLMFFQSVSLVLLISNLLSIKTSLGKYAVLAVSALPISVLLYSAGQSFLWVTLPIIVTGILPVIVYSIHAIRYHWDELTFSGKCLIMTSFIISAHHIDFAFLRDKPEFMTFGFTIAVVEMILLAIFSTSSVLEKVSKEKATVSAEIDIARRIQQDFLPNLSENELIDIDGINIPSSEVGGDFYDIKKVNNDTLFYYGDVTGHGLGAGLGMLMIQNIFNSVLTFIPSASPKALNFSVNKLLCNSFHRLSHDMNACITTMLFSPGQLALSGKHCPILIYHHETQSIDELSVNQIPFGLGFSDDFDESDFSEVVVPIKKNDLLLLATDGVYEASKEGNYDHGILGKDPIKDILKTHYDKPLKDIKDRILRCVLEFTENQLHDDITIVVARIK